MLHPVWWEINRELDQQGPGSDASTLRALSLLPPLAIGLVQLNDPVDDIKRRLAGGVAVRVVRPCDHQHEYPRNVEKSACTTSGFASRCTSLGVSFAAIQASTCCSWFSIACMAKAMFCSPRPVD